MSKPERNSTILIVEDEKPLRQALVDKFTREGFSILEAKDGEEGLRAAQDKHPALILLDIIMPKMDGMTMLQELRRDDAAGKIPVIILTNLTDAKAVEKAVGQGVYDFLVKSDWRLEEVVAKVKKKLG